MNSRDQALALGLAIALMLSIALAACLHSYPAPAPATGAPVEQIADNDAGAPPPDDSAKTSPTLPLPPPAGVIAMADTR